MARLETVSCHLCPSDVLATQIVSIQQANVGTIKVCSECARHYMCEACYVARKSLELPEVATCRHPKQYRFEWLMLVKFHTAMLSVLMDAWVMPTPALTSAMRMERQALGQILYHDEDTEESSDSKDTQMSADQD